jgi:hypothetical protein
MDSVELARQVAAELHARLVESGADPWSPYDFAVAEAKRRGIDVEPTAPGAAVLNGGRATFVGADDLILHESAGSVFEQGFLVAHEIGHVELGDNPDSELALTIDPERAAEPSPVGMDLFARELLLPRTVARALHVDQGLSASAIAAKLGAPFKVVAVQGRRAAVVRCFAGYPGTSRGGRDACGAATQSLAGRRGGASG